MQWIKYSKGAKDTVAKSKKQQELEQHVGELTQDLQRMRADFENYVLDEHNCPHCVRQCRSGGGSSRNVFATEQFDAYAHDDRRPPYPKRVIFRLRNTCNLACAMCDGWTSSRIRKERDNLPATPSMYDEGFFAEMREIIPHLEHVEFYGGEPFLVEEHLRILDMMRELRAKCTIYVNTNTTAFHPRAKRAIEELNFVEFAVSMDALHGDLHGEIRRGLQAAPYIKNFDYLLELRERKGTRVMLNVTEHRLNWFELPEIFRFAEKHHVYLHINTCIHPHNVTLYTLPTDQLRYVLAFFEEEGKALLGDYPNLSNKRGYEHLMALVRDELSQRKPGWRPEMTVINKEVDGSLAAPRPGLRPFHEPERVEREADRIVASVDAAAASHLLTQMVKRIRESCEPAYWHWTAKRLEGMLAKLQPAAADANV